PAIFTLSLHDALLVLTIDQGALAEGYGSVVLTPEVIQVLGLLQQGGQPSAEQAQLVISAISGIDDKDALDSEELENIATATAAYNNVIQGLAQANGLVYVDAMDLLNRLA